jgi:LPS sulfotransferase NodH
VLHPEPPRKARAPLDLGEGEQLAWIMGSSRSGSTWLLRMLADTDRVAPIDDPHIGHHLGVWRPIPLAWAAASEVPDLTTLTEVKREKPDYFFSDRYRDAWMPALRDLIAARFGAQAADVAAERSIAEPMVVVKEPGSHAADLLLDLFPRSRLIFLLRDGRDVVDSWVDAYQSGSWAQEEGAFPVASHGRIALVRWLASVWLFRTQAVQRAFARHHPFRRVLIRYEDLLADPATELGRVAKVLGLEIGADRLGEIGASREFDQVSANERGGGKAVRAADPGRWRRNLSAVERGEMLRIIGDKVAELGYLDGSAQAARRRAERAASLAA